MKPQRKCAGCGELKDKKELIRVVRTPEGEFRIDTTGKAAGRGAYICRKKECLEAAKKNKEKRNFYRNLTQTSLQVCIIDVPMKML